MKTPDTEPEKTSRIRQISALNRKLKKKDKIIGRYKSLYEKEQDFGANKEGLPLF